MGFVLALFVVIRGCAGGSPDFQRPLVWSSWVGLGAEVVCAWLVAVVWLVCLRVWSLCTLDVAGVSPRRGILFGCPYLVHVMIFNQRVLRCCFLRWSCSPRRVCSFSFLLSIQCQVSPIHGSEFRSPAAGLWFTCIGSVSWCSFCV